MRKPLIIFPELIKVTDAERAAGFCERNIVFKDGRTETITIYQPDPVCMVEIFKMDTVTKTFYATVSHALREDMAFVATLHDKCLPEIFLAAHGLESEAVFRKALSARGEIGQMMIQENFPGGSQNQEGN